MDTKFTDIAEKLNRLKLSYKYSLKIAKKETVDMEKRMAKVYVLAGVWNHEDYDGTEVIDVSEDFEKLHEKIEEIKKNFAADYLPRTQGNLTEEKGERYYEVTDENGAYAKFYITEHYIDSESIKSRF